MSRCLVIIDRDGVINQDSKGFIKSPAEWLPIAGSLEAIGILSRAEFDIAVVTNQSGIGRNLFTPETLEHIHQKMLNAAGVFNGKIGMIASCPHHPSDGCACRKPKTGLMDKVAEYYLCPLEGVPMIGDSLRDIDAAIAVGGRPILVLTGNGLKTMAVLKDRGCNVESYPDLLGAATALVKERKNQL
ncbi:MAG: D-glycero-beta-D-manno-heptose-1,7-bisphosphate 7-phosphatase [Woeseia sp.]|nr:D-glycero-beta-D-manno-heptose-1,7-bisphosphate 7-phosphatase [Woeseia sp.]|tara:strand:+ start:145 stop:705 length:561 start_codon:yes stop_codon:yes gene_type:complete